MTFTVQDFTDHLNKTKLRNVDKAPNELIDNQFQAWTKWQLTGTIQDINILGDDMIIVSQHEDEYTLNKITLDELPTGKVSVTSGNACLDMAARPFDPGTGNAVVYDNVNDVTKIYTPYSLFNSVQGTVLIADPNVDAGYSVKATPKSDTDGPYFEVAKDLNLLVLVPEFSEQNFPQVWGFNYGNIKNFTSEPINKNLHAFSAIEPLANGALKRFKLKSNNWGIYGHGAGAHFVHRYVLHNPEASHTLAIAANLGWYLSMTDQEWPFGLKNSGINDSQLKKAFSRYFLLMLGRADTSTKPNSPYVRENWNTINLQGKHRLERGRNFFKSAVNKSKEVDQFFKWGMVEVPTTKGHSNTEQMVPYAAEMFYARLK